MGNIKEQNHEVESIILIPTTEHHDNSSSSATTKGVSMCPSTDSSSSDDEAHDDVDDDYDDDDDDEGKYDHLLVAYDTNGGTTTKKARNNSNSTNGNRTNTNDSNSNNDNEYGYEQHSNELEYKVQEFMRTISIRDFFCKFDPWLIVPTGSFLGIFDWVPEHQRMGPWTLTAKVYFVSIVYSIILFGAYIIGQVKYSSTTGNSSSNLFMDYDNLQYPPLFSGWWYYNVAGFSWMSYIIYYVVNYTPFSYASWSTYTAQAWMILTIRHGLCIIAPISQIALYMAELMKFPCAVTSTLTYTAWNFIIFPIAYFFIFKKKKHKMILYKFSTCFMMLNMHVLNMFLCICNVMFSTPNAQRQLNMVDLYISLVFLVMYMSFYFLVLDRIGFHLYKDYSPRSHPAITTITWGATLFGYIFYYYLWREILMPDKYNYTELVLSTTNEMISKLYEAVQETLKVQ